jgi:hypothetical protein
MTLVSHFLRFGLDASHEQHPDFFASRDFPLILSGKGSIFSMGTPLRNHLTLYASCKYSGCKVQGVRHGKL